VQDERCHCERCVGGLASVYLCLGSNLGDRQENLCRALRLLSLNVSIEQVSSIYETRPVPLLHRGKEQPWFLNMVCRISTSLSPGELLCLAKDTEAEMGRVPGGEVNSPRSIDVDILLYDTMIMETPSLIIPHPRMRERAFVLIPLAEIAPELVPPGLGKTIGELAGDVEGKDGVRKCTGGVDVSTICGRAL